MHFDIPPNITLPAQSLLHANRPGVYAWIRDEKYLYIGQSIKVLTRIASHNIIGTPINPLLPTDKIVIWYFETLQEAIRKEMEMIMEYLPPLNFPGLRDKLTIIKCAYCGKEFKRVRRWQKFCSKRCQTGNGDLDYKNLQPLE